MTDREFSVTVVEQTPPYILCKVYVDITIAIAMRLAEASIEYGARTQIMNYLMDLRGVRNVAGVGENYKYTHDYLKHLKLIHNNVAMLIDVDDDSHIFVETLTRNAGHNVKVFHSEREALSWLASADSSIID